MVCSKCGYAIARGQSSCVYCGTKVDTTKTENTAPKRTTSAFAKQLKSAQPDARAEKTAATAVKEEQKSVQKPADTSSAPKSSAFLSQKQPSISTAASVTAKTPSDPRTANSPFARQPAGEPAAKPQIVAPYAFRPMYSAFDPNSADSPFVRKPLEVEPEAEPETQKEESVSQITEEQPEEKVLEVEPVSEEAGEKTHKKNHGLPIAALTLAFVTLAFCLFIYI